MPRSMRAPNSGLERGNGESEAQQSPASLLEDRVSAQGRVVEEHTHVPLDPLKGMRKPVDAPS